jgi:hypothetical protein
LTCCRLVAIFFYLWFALYCLLLLKTWSREDSGRDATFEVSQLPFVSFFLAIINVFYLAIKIGLSR